MTTILCDTISGAAGVLLAVLGMMMLVKEKPTPVDLAKIHRFYGSGERCRACGELGAHAWHVHPYFVRTMKLATADDNSLASLMFAVAPEAAVWEDHKLHAVFVECLPEHWQAIKRIARWWLPVGVLLVIVWFGAAYFTKEDIKSYIEAVLDDK
jgi:hypothetical protein